MNLKVRAKNPIFWAQIFLSIVAPVGAYFGFCGQDVTSWGIVFDLIGKALRNPYVVVMVIVSVWNAMNDPTTEGVRDSIQAMAYDTPKKR